MPVERFVSALAAGGGNGTIGNPWTLSEMYALIAPNDRGWVKRDGIYTRNAADTLVNAGTFDAPIWIWGYNTVPGDGYQGRDANGFLITTNMPEINYVGNSSRAFANKAYVSWNSINFSASYGGAALTLGVNNWVENCKVHNISNSAASTDITMAGSNSILNCDLFLSGDDASACLVVGTSYPRVIGCRFKGMQKGNGINLSNNTTGPAIIGCTFDSLLNAVAITGTNNTAAPNIVVQNCTAYNLASAFIQTANSALSAPATTPIVINNHVTDSLWFMQNLYAATANAPRYTANNRLRDIVNADAGWIEMGRGNFITTDAGGPETDYVNAAAGNFRLIEGAPGRATGWRENLDIGAWQSAPATGGGVSAGPRIVLPRRNY